MACRKTPGELEMPSSSCDQRVAIRPLSRKASVAAATRMTSSPSPGSSAASLGTSRKCRRVALLGAAAGGPSRRSCGSGGLHSSPSSPMCPSLGDAACPSTAVRLVDQCCTQSFTTGTNAKRCMPALPPSSSRNRLQRATALTARLMDPTPMACSTGSDDGDEGVAGAPEAAAPALAAAVAARSAPATAATLEFSWTTQTPPPVPEPSRPGTLW
mmetsp:Transcript_75966/g.217585  ORF Transcript_75966/g.217585 Transcript_75966/m.217585 type:complete len:214 (+) Transcript_75966:305-946(+)